MFQTLNIDLTYNSKMNKNNILKTLEALNDE